MHQLDALDAIAAAAAAIEKACNGKIRGKFEHSHNTTTVVCALAPRVCVCVGV